MLRAPAVRPHARQPKPAMHTLALWLHIAAATESTEACCAIRPGLWSHLLQTRTRLQVIDPVAPRHTGIVQEAMVPVTISNGPAALELSTIARHRDLRGGGQEDAVQDQSDSD